MPTIHGEVIELSSSPEPIEPPPLRRSTRARSTPIRNLPPTNNKKTNDKGKGKAKAALGPVIELSDSDDVVELVRMTPSQSQSQAKASTSYSSQRPRHSPSLHRPKPAGASSSVENILSPPTTPSRSGTGAGIGEAPSSSLKKRKAGEALPLFLQSPGSSDGENGVSALDGRFSKKSKGKGKQRQRESLGPAQRDEEQETRVDKEKEKAGLAWNNDFWNKPFPFMADGVGPEPAALDPLAADGDLFHPSQPDVVDPLQPPIANPLETTVNALQPVVRPPSPIPDPIAVPEAIPEPEVDPASRAIAQILEIIPNVDPDYLLGVVNTHLPTLGVQTAEHVLGLLFEDSGWPKIETRRAAAKRKSDVGVEGAGKDKEENKPKRPKVDYRSVDRSYEGGPNYHCLSLIQLQTSFPHIPKPYIRRQLEAHRNFYAPTHLFIAAGEKAFHDAQAQRQAQAAAGVGGAGPWAVLPYSRKKMMYNPAKDRDRLRLENEEPDPTFEEEKRWLEGYLDGREDEYGEPMDIDHDEVEGKGKGKEKAPAEDVDEEDELAEGEGIECQCCFSEYRFDKMVQCPEAHLFCSECVSQYASTQLGSHNASINCMHSSECKQPFPVSELRRILDSKLMDLYERVKQQKEIEEAGLEGLEECPFCEWKCVIEASKEEEKLFRCGNDETVCGVVSCRMCKKVDHLPRSCKEVEDDKHLDGRHAIEEAMSRALMRNCPKCSKAFIKDAGCNKMTCPHCRTLSCYVCRQIIKGYDHFDQTPAHAASSSRKSGKCALWDPVEQRHADEVKAAAEKALADYKRDHPDVEDEAVKVDIPVAPPLLPQMAPMGGPYVGVPQNGFNIAAMNMQAYHHAQHRHAHLDAGIPGYPMVGMGMGMPYPHPAPMYHRPPLPIPPLVIPPQQHMLNARARIQAAQQRHIDQQFQVLDQRLGEQQRMAQEAAEMNARIQARVRREAEDRTAAAAARVRAQLQAQQANMLKAQARAQRAETQAGMRALATMQARREQNEILDRARVQELARIRAQEEEATRVRQRAYREGLRQFEDERQRDRLLVEQRQLEHRAGASGTAKRARR